LNAFFGFEDAMVKNLIVLWAHCDRNAEF